MLKIVDDEDGPRLDRDKWHNPLVSVIVTHHNYSEHLEDALLSLLDQTHANWECVVVDDASDNHHWMSAKGIVHKLNHPRIKFIVLPENVGQIPAFFAGLDATKGEFVCLLDPDDRYDQSFLAEALDAHLSEVLFCPIVCTDQRLVLNGTMIAATNTGHKLNSLAKPRGVVEVPAAAEDKLLYFPATQRGWHWTSSSAMMFRRAALVLIRPHKTLAYKGSADSYLAYGCHLLGGSLFLTKPLVYRTVHAGNAYLGASVFATRQNKKKDGVTERGPECLADVTEAIEHNGGGHHLKKAEKKTAANRWRRSIRKRWRKLTGRGQA